jgi:hypothetical protein
METAGDESSVIHAQVRSKCMGDEKMLDKMMAS